ncbi:MAG: His/Gly/Thr/Pro-type tRNA ligase C-terminal domain-containing protein, partial [Alphaproteobacteria bacterium]
DAACMEAYAKLGAAGCEVLYDDRDERPGVKFADADLIGIPWRLVIGPRGLKDGKVELKRRDGTVADEVALSSAIDRLVATGRG